MDGSERPKISVAGAWVGASAIIGCCLLAASSGSIQLWQAPDSSGNPAVREPAAPPAQEEPPEVSDGAFDWPDLSWLLDVVNVLALAFLVFALALSLSNRRSWRWRRRTRATRPAGARVTEPTTEFRIAPVDVDVDAAEAALAVGTPRNAIVGCWMQLERDASAVGLERRGAETAAEYVERVVASSSVDPGPIAELAALYREARFSTHELDDVHRDQAWSALQGVAAQLTTNRARV